MKFAVTPFTSFNRLVLAVLLATAGACAMAQGAPAAAPAAPSAAAPADPHGEPMSRMGRHDPAKMRAWVAKHQAELKARLKITPAQEAAWATYTAAMQPPEHMAMGARPTPEQRAEFDKLSTPERIDKMRALRNQRMAEMNAVMDKRGEATKAFYATLTPEQQKTFDAEHRKHGPRGGRDGKRGGQQQPG